MQEHLEKFFKILMHCFVLGILAYPVVAAWTNVPQDEPQRSAVRRGRWTGALAAVVILWIYANYDYFERRNPVFLVAISVVCGIVVGWLCGGGVGLIRRGEPLREQSPASSWTRKWFVFRTLDWQFVLLATPSAPVAGRTTSFRLTFLPLLRTALQVCFFLLAGFSYIKLASHRRLIGIGILVGAASWLITKNLANPRRDWQQSRLAEEREGTREP